MAAELKASRKTTKYAQLCAGVGSKFAPAVVERFGTCCDSLVGFVRMIAGTGDRDPLTDDDFSFAASSRATYLAQRCVFAAVMADAAMLFTSVGLFRGIKEIFRHP